MFLFYFCFSFAFFCDVKHTPLQRLYWYPLLWVLLGGNLMPTPAYGKWQFARRFSTCAGQVIGAILLVLEVETYYAHVTPYHRTKIRAMKSQKDDRSVNQSISLVDIDKKFASYPRGPLEFAFVCQPLESLESPDTSCFPCILHSILSSII